MFSDTADERRFWLLYLKSKLHTQTETQKLQVTAGTDTLTTTCCDSHRHTHQCFAFGAHLRHTIRCAIHTPYPCRVQLVNPSCYASCSVTVTAPAHRGLQEFYFSTRFSDRVDGALHKGLAERLKASCLDEYAQALELAQDKRRTSSRVLLTATSDLANQRGSTSTM